MIRQERLVQEGRYFQHNGGGSELCAPVQSTSSIGLCHSEMAMHAAKKMRRSKQKQKTGRVVCHHLRMMLAANEPVVPLLSTSTSTSKSSGLSPSNVMSSVSSVPQAQKVSQFSLGI
jgi:hypothetical protein